MKVPPALNLNPDINRGVGMASLPFGAESLFWRYGSLSPFQHQHSSAPPTSPLLDVKNQMPNHLAPDPRMWTRDDVSSFLRWFEREFELPKIDSSKFCMNGKALCMLTKTDLAARAPGAGDVLHNTLQFLLRDAPQVPPSPITPHLPLLSPSQLTQSTNQPWPLVSSADFHGLGHLLQQGGSVTLSPAPSDQSGGSPRHPESNSATNLTYQHSSSASTGSTHSGSHSDSEESTRDSNSPQRSPISLPPHSMASSFSAQALASLKHFSDCQRAAAAAAAAAVAVKHEDAQQHQLSQSNSPSLQQPTLPSSSGDEPVETGTNGRLLWDFLQQLLNDSQQRYSRFISWKNRETGVFKIVDPPGLARLWGIQKNHLSMNYDKMSRALRYYYRVNILRKVQGERHCYQFLRNPSELKSIKNISLLRGAPVPSTRTRDSTPTSIVQSAPATAPMESMDEDEGPTDLSMPTIHHHHFEEHSMEPQQPQNLSIERTDVKTESITTDFYE